jgi:hypothetical protein
MSAYDPKRTFSAVLTHRTTNGSSSYSDIHFLINAVRSANSILSSIALFSQARIFGTLSLGIIFSIADGCLVIGSAAESPFENNQPLNTSMVSIIAERDMMSFLKLAKFAAEKSPISSKFISSTWVTPCSI